MFTPYRRNPESGDIVRCTQFGDDHHRKGVVTAHVGGGVALVDFASCGDRRLHRNDLELWAPLTVTFKKGN